MATGLSHMASERTVYGGLTVSVVLGTIVLLSGLILYSATDPNMVLVGLGGAIMVVGILAMGGYTHALPEAEGAEGGH